MDWYIQILSYYVQINVMGGPGSYNWSTFKDMPHTFLSLKLLIVIMPLKYLMGKLCSM